MWRALALAVVIAFAATPAVACEDPYNIQGLIYRDIPADTPPSALILDVIFDETTDRGPLTAHVRRVVQGEYREPIVRLGIVNSSCLDPLIFGREGLIIGELREGVERQSFGPNDRPLVLTRGFEGTWFRPLVESVAERRDRTGMDWFARTMDGRAIEGAPTASGDFDGDGKVDSAAFFEDEDGNLVIAVARAADDNYMPIIWGGDLSSLPHFTFRTAGPGVYRNLCHLYDPDCGGAPSQVTLTHDGIIVTALEGPAEYLYYWEDGRFKDIIISE
ncbi:MAG: hypothetical protein R3C27_03740 [Hyphomonadaceae bacterium]